MMDISSSGARYGNANRSDVVKKKRVKSDEGGSAHKQIILYDKYLPMWGLGESSHSPLVIVIPVRIVVKPVRVPVTLLTYRST
jgi:hypothetical protein